MIPSPRLLIAAGALTVAFLAGWWTNGTRWEARTSQEARERAESGRQAAIRAAAMQRELSDARDVLAARLQLSDDQHAKALETAQHETNRLRDCVAAGTCGLRVLARCPAPGVPEPASSASSAGVDPGTGAELDGAAGPAYFALRDGIDQAAAKLSACQEQLKLRADQAAQGSETYRP